VEDADLISRLKALSSAGKARPNHTARLRVHLRYVEKALGEGASLPQVFEEFNRGQGDSALTFSSFKSALKRVRGEERGGKELAEGRLQRRPEASKVAGEGRARPSMADFMAPPVRK
jgi:hypothetical protein